jgi:hypothetical protein
MTYHLRGLLAVVLIAGVTRAASADSGSLEVFSRRILPIMNSAKPSSCVECHLSGVDLKDYIRPNQEETFAALVKAGMIDVKQPRKSKLLEFIGRAPEKPTIVSSKARAEELAAFTAWIESAVNDPELLKAKAGTEQIGPALPVEVIHHARKDRILASFVDNIWTEATRCAGCHSPLLNEKQVKEFGEQVSWIKPDDPAATLAHLVDAGLIDLEDPTQSMILLKPTMQVKHGGGIKMVVGDRSYKQFRKFIEDYAAMSAAKYSSVDELPETDAEVSRISEVWFKLTDIPESFDKQLLQVDLFREDPQSESGWSKDRWATSDRPVFGKGGLWQHSLSIIAPRGSERAKQVLDNPSLPRGKYLVRIYIDSTGRMQSDWKADFTDQDLIGEIEVNSEWPAGYGNMTVAKFPEQ